MQLKGRWQSWARTVETGQEWIWDTRWEPSQQAGLVCSCSELSLWWGQQRAGSVLASTCCVPQSCLTLCDPTDHSPPGSSVHEILQARIEERVAMSSSRGSSQPRDGTCVSCISYTAGGDAPGHQHTQNFLQHWVTPCVSPALTHFTEGPTSLSCHPPHTHTPVQTDTGTMETPPGIMQLGQFLARFTSLPLLWSPPPTVCPLHGWQSDSPVPHHPNSR